MVSYGYFKSHMDEVWIWKHWSLWRQLIEQILMNRDRNCCQGFLFLVWSDFPHSKTWCLKLLGMWTLQVWKNTSFPPKWKRHQNLIVLSLFCQTIHGVHVSRNLFHLNNPCVQITPLSLCCKLFPRSHHWLHQNIGGLSNRQPTLNCIPWHHTDGSSYFQEFQLLRTSNGNDFLFQPDELTAEAIYHFHHSKLSEGQYLVWHLALIHNSFLCSLQLKITVIMWQTVLKTSPRS